MTKPLSAAQKLVLEKMTTLSLFYVAPMTRRKLKELGFITFVRLGKGKFKYTITDTGRKALADAATVQEA